MKKLLTLIFGLFLATAFLASCKKDKKSGNLQNEFIKRTQSPMMVGTTIEFAYGAGSTNSKLAAMQAIASIPGATGTGFEMVTHRTVNAVDITTVVASGAATNGGTSTVNITDTAATTLRYLYVVPEAARGQQVSFAFSVSNKAGDQANTSSPAYTMSAMDMVRSITVTGTAAGSRYFSIADMRAYTQAEVDAGSLSAKIDFVYAYAATVSPSGTAYAYGHSVVSPNVSATYLPAGYTVPANWTKNNTLMERKSATNFFDGQLKGDANIAIYIDDIDLAQQKFEGSPNYVLGLTADNGTFMKTADGKYTAFIYVNSVNNTTPSAVVSIKRYKNF